MGRSVTYSGKNGAFQVEVEDGGNVGPEAEVSITKPA